MTAHFYNLLSSLGISVTMSSAGPSRMYAQQAVAYSARDSLLGEHTDSTPDTPPTIAAPDLEGLCALKRQVVENLPAACVHCGAEMLKEYCVELKDQCVISYCKKKGACGRSLVLFAGFDRTYPIYSKTCCFKQVEEAAPVEFEAPTELAGREQQSMLSVEQTVFAALSRRQGLEQEQLDIYALHGIVRPDAKCATCERAYSTHRKCDQYGWYESSRACYKLPSEWPGYVEPGTWATEREQSNCAVV